MNIIERILLEEGGYVNDPADAGGETKYGISKRAYPNEDIKNITKERAKELLVRDYIEEPGFDKLAPGSLRDQLIDFGFNSGPYVAIQLVQAIVGVTVDGKLGPATLAAISARDPLRVNNQLVMKRLEFIAAVVVRRPANLRFLKGWVKRALSFMVV